MFRGSFTALVTPFRNGAFDEAAFEQQVRFQIDHGTNGVVPVGTTGESPTLSHEEHRRVFEVCVGVCRGTGVKVIAGTGSNSTDEALELTAYAKKIGADGALMVNPYYNKPSQEGMYQHFRKVAQAVDLPIVLYNIPGRTGVTMSHATVGRLVQDCRNIVAMKEATGSVESCTELVNMGVTVLSGDDGLTLPFMSVGAVGVISVASNIVPGAIRKLVDAVLGNNLDEAREIHLKHFDLFKSLFLEGNPAGIKAAMRLLGRDTGDVRLPLWEVSGPTKMAIRQQLVNVGLLDGTL